MKLRYRMHFLVAGFIGFQAFSLLGQERAVTLHTNLLLRWHRYSYAIQSSYPYLDQLPPWSAIPTLLEWINSDRTDAGVEVAYSQPTLCVLAPSRLCVKERNQD